MNRRQFLMTSALFPIGFSELRLPIQGVRKALATNEPRLISNTRNIRYLPGELTIAFGHSASGKTKFGVELARTMALRHNFRVAFFSIEMAKPQIIMRFLSAEAEISLKDLRCGDYAPQRGEALLSAATRLAEATLYIEDMDPLTPGLIRECLHKNYFGGQNSNELVIVDYFQLLKGDIAGKSVKEKLANNSMQLKFIAAEFNVPVVALSMLTRTNSPMETVRTDRYARAVSRFADQIVVIRDSATI